MTFEINTESKSVTIKSFGHTFKEIKNDLRKVLGKDWEDYKLYVDNSVTYIPSFPQSYPWTWYDATTAATQTADDDYWGQYLNG